MALATGCPPMPFPPIAAQVAAARTSALVVPAPELAALVVTGTERLSWLNGILTCELAGRVAWDAVYGLQVALKGRIVSDVIVVVDLDRVLLLVQRAVAEEVAATLDRHLMMEDAVVEPAFDSLATWMVHGPEAGRVLAAARTGGGVGGLLDRTGLGGAVVVGPSPKRGAPGDPPQPGAVVNALVAALREVGGVFGDDAGWEALRLERAVPKFGVDFDGENYPQEAALEKTAVSFSKGCYLGQEVVCMLELRGHVKNKLVALVIEGVEVPARGMPVVDERDAAVGEVTSAAQSPELQRPVALAMVKYATAKAGGVVKVGTQPARIVERPA
jgi:folate-binding protein YgfZ